MNNANDISITRSFGFVARCVGVVAGGLVPVNHMTTVVMSADWRVGAYIETSDDRVYNLLSDNDFEEIGGPHGTTWMFCITGTEWAALAA